MGFYGFFLWVSMVFSMGFHRLSAAEAYTKTINISIKLTVAKFHFQNWNLKWGRNRKRKIKHFGAKC
jgi:hypothetical protein